MTTNWERARGQVQLGFDWVKEHGAKHKLDLARVDPGTLDINSMDTCVLAQASGLPFEDILYALYLAGVHREMSTWCEDHGFIGMGYEDLVKHTTQCWRDLLTQETAAV